jgi:hypothetical protein
MALVNDPEQRLSLKETETNDSILAEEIGKLTGEKVSRTTSLACHK